MQDRVTAHKFSVILPEKNRLNRRKGSAGREEEEPKHSKKGTFTHTRVRPMLGVERIVCSLMLDYGGG